MPTDGWFQYEQLTTDYQIDPGLKCVAIASAKNILGEWGPVTELYFTTPDKMPGEENEESVLELKVDVAELLGAETNIYATIGEDSFIASVPARDDLKTGSVVKLAFDMSKCHLFDAETEKCLTSKL